MLTTKQAIFAIRTIYPQLDASAHGRLFWVLCMVEGDVQLSDAEIHSWNVPGLTEPSPEQIAAAWTASGQQMDRLDQIQALEASVTPRRQRDAVLTAEGRAWLANIEAQIAALRAG